MAASPFAGTIPQIDADPVTVAEHAIAVGLDEFSAELTAVIGFVGMEEAVRAFSAYRLLCIDEFELDDVANTLMAVTFLRSVLPSEDTSL